MKLKTALAVSASLIAATMSPVAIAPAAALDLTDVLAACKSGGTLPGPDWTWLPHLLSSSASQSYESVREAGKSGNYFGSLYSVTVTQIYCAALGPQNQIAPVAPVGSFFSEIVTNGALLKKNVKVCQQTNGSAHDSTNVGDYDACP